MQTTQAGHSICPFSFFLQCFVSIGTNGSLRIAVLAAGRFASSSASYALLS
jgi:hypothetical protein